MRGIVDAGHNMVFEAHQYLDADSSGTSPNCVSATIGAERLQVFTAWLRTNGYRGFLGEFAGGANATCNQAVSNMLTYVEANADVWTGWTWWAAGPWWGSYMYSIEPNGGTDQPQMATLAPYLD
jgi:endoglucanase